MQASDLIYSGAMDSILEMVDVFVTMYPCKGNLEAEMQTLEVSDLIKASNS